MQAKARPAKSAAIYVAKVALLAGLCFGAGRLGLSLAVIKPNVTLLWPPAGIALAAMLFFGYRLWPGIALGAFLAAITIKGTPVLSGLGIALGNTLQAVVGAWLLQRLGKFNFALARVQDVLALVTMAGLLSTTIGASLGVLSLCAGKVIPWQDFSVMWWAWWLGDVMGHLVIAPVALTWGARLREPWPRKRIIEAGVLFAAVVGFSLWIFSGQFATQITNYPLAYGVFPFVIWAAFRFGPRGAATTTFLVSSIAIWETLHGFGPFAGEVKNEVLVLWYAFAGLVALTSLVLAAVISERQQAETALLQSETRYRNLFTRSPIAIWEEDFTAVGQWLDQLRAKGVADLDAYLKANPEALPHAVSLVKVSDVNDTSVAMFQADAKAQLLVGLDAIIKEDSLFYFAEELKTIWEGKNQLDLEITRTTLKGNRVDYILHWVAPVESDRLNLAHIIVAITDITERKQTEEENRRVLKFLETLINNTPAVAIQIYDRQGRVQLWNPASEVLYGFRADEIKGLRAQDTILASTDVPAFEQDLARIWQTQQAADPGEYTVQRKDGARRYIYSAMFPLVHEGESVGLCCMDVDITPRKQAEEKLLESEMRYRVLAENSAVGIWHVRPDGETIYLNPAMCAMLEIQSVEELAARPYYSFFTEGSLARMKIEQTKHIQGIVSSYEAEIVGTQGGRRHVFITGAPLFDAQGNLESLIGTLIDISEQKRMESRKAALSQLGQRLGLATTPREALWIVAEVAGTLFQWDSCRLDFYASEEDQIQPFILLELEDGLRMERRRPDSPAAPTPLMRQILAKGGRLLPQRESLAVPLERDDDHVRLQGALMCVPVRHGQKVIGILSVQSATENAYNQEDLATLQSLADLCGSVLERIRAQEALQESEQRFRSLFENSPVGIAIARKGIVRQANQAYLRMFGYEQIAGVSLLDQIAPNCREEIAALVNAREDGKMAPTSYETMGQRKDGSFFPFYVEVARIGLPEGLATVAFITDITARKLAEEALRESEASFRLMFASNPLAMWVYDGETLQFLEVNESAIKHYGYTRVEFLAMRISDLGPPVDSTEFKKQLAEQASEPAFSGPWLHRLKNRQTINVQIVAHRLEFAGRKAVLVVAEDISDRLRAEEALRLSEERFRIAAENTSDLIYEWDIRKGRLTWFGNIDEQLQFAPGEFPRTLEAWKDAIHPADRARVLRALELHLQSKAPYFQEYRVRRKDGSHLYWLDRATALWDEHGHPYKWVGATSNITARKQAEEEQQKLVALVENSSDLIGLASLDGRMFYLNEAGRKLVGLEHDAEVLAANFSDLFAENELAKYLEYIQPTFMTTGRWEGESRLRHSQTGKAIDVQMSIFVVRQPSTGEPLCLATVTRDITERKLLEGQFRQSQKMEAVGRLAGGIAHDFNNLLMAILGYSDLVLENLNAGDPLRDEVWQIRKAGERAAALTHQLLAFSRKQMLQSKVLDLNGVVEDMRNMLRRLIGEDVELVNVLEPELGQVRADRGQIEQVIVNLAINARDAMPEGGKLTLETRNLKLDASYAQLHPGVRSGEYVMLAVRDTGCGMPPEVKSHLFEPFFTTKEVGKGTGLGLSTVYGILKQSGGDIQAESEVGLGSTFKILLPRVDAAPPFAAKPEAGLARLKGTETILFAEDEDAVRGLLSRVLQKHGYTVLEARHGLEALQICERQTGPIHLVLTDVVMPHMSGRELVARLKPLRPNLKVLYISGYTDDSVVNEGNLDPGSAFLQKPFDSDCLLEKIRALLDAS